ncbi:hypothetical protein K9N68_18285 [Kovacikia minuta CCNUW1]|uniref:hypothetical protein n=1 Tax=Kovacikia minuta TaxID=2931930 RepID=UPI001CCB3396|nr:hypothetical protein [Kovacikia minuta]UBF23718.1 hypothetical protein K9N68_18285 [Kovacikia minuta CCNUW1]
MVHTYEVLVDIKESELNNTFRNGTERYEIDADSQQRAGGIARAQVRTTHPQCVEYDIRVTRLLR